VATGPARLRLSDAPSGQAHAAPQLAQLTAAMKRRTAFTLTGRGGIATGRSAAPEPRRRWCDDRKRRSARGARSSAGPGSGSSCAAAGRRRGCPRCATARADLRTRSCEAGCAISPMSAGVLATVGCSSCCGGRVTTQASIGSTDFIGRKGSPSASAAGRKPGECEWQEDKYELVRAEQHDDDSPRPVGIRRADGQVDDPQ
jgi:hypothetical protein